MARALIVIYLHYVATICNLNPQALHWQRDEVVKGWKVRQCPPPPASWSLGLRSITCYSWLKNSFSKYLKLWRSLYSALNCPQFVRRKFWNPIQCIKVRKKTEQILESGSLGPWLRSFLLPSYQQYRISSSSSSSAFERPLETDTSIPFCAVQISSTLVD